MTNPVLWCIERLFGPVDPFGDALCARWEDCAMPSVNRWERAQYHTWGGSPAQQLYRFLDRIEYENVKSDLAGQRLLRDILRGTR